MAVAPLTADQISAHIREGSAMDADQKKILITEIEELGKDDHIELMKILLKNGEQSMTTNSTCTLVDLSELSNRSLWMVYNYVQLCVGHQQHQSQLNKLMDDLEHNRREFSQRLRSEAAEGSTGVEVSEERRLYHPDNVPTYQQLRDETLVARRQVTDHERFKYEDMVKMNWPNSKKFSLSKEVSSK